MRGLKTFGIVLSILAAMAGSALAADDPQLCDNAAKDPDIGIPACTRIISGNQIPNLEAAYNNRGNAWFHKGLYSSAIDDYTAAIERNPAFVDAFRNRGFVLLRQDEFNRAVADLSQAIALDPKSSFAFYLRGFALFRKGEFEGAIKDFDRAIALKPDYYAAFVHRGDAWYGKRDFDRAIRDFDAAIKLDAKNPTAYGERAQVHIDKGDYERAIQNYNKAIELDPKDWRAYSGRGEALRLKGDLDAALASHNKAVELGPQNTDALINRAIALKDKKRYSESVSDYTEALLINPKETRALSNRAEVLRLDGDLARALADIDKAIALFPNSAMNHCRRADVYRDRGELDRAVAEFGVAMRVTANAVCAFTGRGIAFEQSGQHDKARADLEKAQKMAPEKDPDPSMAREARALAKTQLAALNERAKADALRLAAVQQAEAAKRKEEQQEKERQTAAEREQAKQLQSLAALAPPKIDQGRRVALIIGNSGYQNVPQLANPVRDAEAIGAVFRQIGFDSVQVEDNLTRSQMVRALRKFREDADKANWGVVYFAGHGIGLNGTNYLIPIDARMESDRDVEDEAVPLDRMLAATEGAKKLRMVILDACRDNPFANKMRRSVASRSITRGLTAIEPDVGTLVAYAARDGQTALDGDGKHSPFVSSLLKHLVIPNLEIGMLFRLVRDDVRQMTNRQQEPFVYGSLPGENFYFLLK